MACSGAHCSQHGTGTSSCAGHRPPCGTNNALPVSGNYANPGSLITASDINTLKNYIRIEAARYSSHRSFANYGPGSWIGWLYVNAGRLQADHQAGVTVIDDLHANDYAMAVHRLNNVFEPNGSSYGVLPGIQPNTVGVSGGLYITEGQDPAGAYGEASAGQIIPASHWANIRARYDTVRTECICNSDCACNLVCACHNDCGCNYSDERLKENIKYLYTKKGIKLYSFNYIWEKGVTKIGVMAQDLLNTIYSNAVLTDKDGYYKVDYKKLPI